MAVAGGVRGVCGVLAGGWRYPVFEFVPKSQRVDIALAMFTFKVDVSGATGGLKEFRRMLPYIAANTLTGLGQATHAQMPAELNRRFDRPTAFTLKAARVKFANSRDLRSTVGFPESSDAAGRGRTEFMRPGAYGAASRRQKRSEYMLSKKGWLPPGWITVPGSYAKRSLLDAHGNIPGSIYKQLVNSLQIKSGGKAVSKASQRRAAGMGVAAEFFAVAPGANTLGRNRGYLPSGVYRRTRKGLQQYLLFIKRAGYEKRIDLKDTATAVAKVQGAAIVRTAFAEVRQRFAAQASKRAGR